jgi:large subunit ribosomal protein L25
MLEYLSNYLIYSMENIQLQSKARDPKADAIKDLKKQGFIPAELYGHNVPNVHLSLVKNEFEKVLRKAGESTIIQVTAPDKSVHNVLIQDVQRHYLTNEPIHVDFYAVKMTEKLTATVPLEFEGEPDAVKVLAGTLVKVLSEVEVECLPADLPHNIVVDISVLKTFDDQIQIKDLKVSDKVEIKADGEELVAKVQPPRDVEAELAPIEEVDIATAVEGIAEDKPTGDALPDEDKKKAAKDDKGEKQEKKE